MKENKNLSIVGFSKEREKNDFYPTPPEAVEPLFKREKFEGRVWECASGDGSMSKVIEKYNKCISSDLRTDDEVYGLKGKDFLNTKTATPIENIITNPPYKLAIEFVQRAKKLATKKVALLLKLVFLEGINRYEMFQDKKFPLKKIYVFCRRVKIYKKGIKTKNSGLIAYAWFVWDKDYKGEPTIGWINEY